MIAYFTENARELFARIAAGNEAAFKIFFETYWPQVYGTSLRLTKSAEHAKDLSQEIFLKVWESRGKLAGVENPESYLYIVSKNYIMDQLRKKVFDPENMDYLINYFSSEVMNPQETIEFREFENRINGAIESLPTKVKEVFMLSRTEGLTHEQIAAKLDISVVSSKTYIVRALQQIRQYLLTHPEHVLIILLLNFF